MYELRVQTHSLSLFSHIFHHLKLEEYVKMDQKSITEYIIQKYQEDEQVMIQLFVQWCQNHDIDPFSLYQKAYPAQGPNEAINTIIENNEPMDLDIESSTLIDVLQLFGNDDLAFVVSEEAQKFPTD